MTDDATTVVPEYDAVPVPGAGEDPTPVVLRREIDDWVSSTAFRDLATAEGADPTGSLAERLAYLDGFSAAAWDFRASAARARQAGYVERNQVDRDIVSGARELQVLASARALGLVDARSPRGQNYGHVLVLGGLVRANLWRTAYAAELIRSGRVRTSSVSALTAFRPLARNEDDPSQDEIRLRELFGAPIREHESEVLEDALRNNFRLDSLDIAREGGDLDAPSRFRVAVGSAQGVEVRLVAAPNPNSARRANTAQTMRYWASEVAHVQRGDSILFVTSTIYVPFQHAVAVQHLGLPFGARVETIGVDHSVIDPHPLPQGFRGVNYLQELRSSIRAYRQLLVLVDEADNTPGPA